mgnify:CR=1 FL=1
MDNDNGTILRYAAHENSVLRQIKQQMLEESETEYSDYIDWIDTLRDLTGYPDTSFNDMITPEAHKNRLKTLFKKIIFKINHTSCGKKMFVIFIFHIYYSWL